MKKSAIVFLVVIACSAWAQLQAQAAASSVQRILKVKLNYTGVGVVDKKHQIYVFLSDSNPYTASRLIDATSAARPPEPAAGVSHIFASRSTARKDATVIFRDLPVFPIYAIAVFDKSGTCNGDIESLPPRAPMGVYGTFPDKLAAIKIEAGQTVEVGVSFDDSTTTP